jgi:hypothetical protein
MVLVPLYQIMVLSPNLCNSIYTMPDMRSRTVWVCLKVMAILLTSMVKAFRYARERLEQKGDQREDG